LCGKYSTIIVNIQCDNQDYTNICMVAKQHGNPRCLQRFALGAKNGCKLDDQFFVFEFPNLPLEIWWYSLENCYEFKKMFKYYCI